MSFDLASLREALARHGRVARVVVAEVRGSAPREAGAAMLVWDGGQSGTIGGGALEWDAAEHARHALVSGATRVDRIALGPALGQCCGGAVVLVTEVWTAEALPAEGDDLVVRPLPGAHPTRPLSVARTIARSRDRGATVPTTLHDDWLIEPILKPKTDLWVWGAGHVGRAIVGAFTALPDVQITWVDTADDRFPGDIPDGVNRLVAVKPEELVKHTDPAVHHLILTYSHTLDLELCHRLLDHGFASAGLIGSATKWARFRSRLATLGHNDSAISRIACPIGDPSLGKHPQAIAIGVAAAFLRGQSARKAEGERA